MVRRVVALCSLVIVVVLVAIIVTDHPDRRPVPRLVIVPPRLKLTVHCVGPSGGFPCYWSNGAPFPDGRGTP